MDLNIKKKTINTYLIIAFVVISIVVPGDILNLKKVLFLVLCLFNMKVLIHSFFKKGNEFYVIAGFIFPILLIIYSAILTSDFGTSFARSFAAFIFLLILIIKYYDIDYEKILLNSLNLILIITLAIVFADYFSLIDVNKPGLLREVIYGYDIGIIGKSETYSFYYKVFLKSSPLLVILLFSKFYNNKLFTVGLVITALILSGTRANVIFPISLLFLYYIFFAVRSSKKIKILLLVSFTAFLIIFSSNLFISFNETFITKGEYSNQIRLGHIEGLKLLIYDNPLIVIFGSGMGSSFYSFGSNSFVSSIEWSYLDLWRQMGFFFLLFLI